MHRAKQHEAHTCSDTADFTNFGQKMYNVTERGLALVVGDGFHRTE
jgi:hypothetical protein